MPAEYNPASETYDPKECGQPLVEAVVALAEKTGQAPHDFIGRSLQQIFEEADAVYDELPEFWCVWKEWHLPQPPPELGDL